MTMSNVAKCLNRKKRMRIKKTNVGNTKLLQKSTILFCTRAQKNPKQITNDKIYDKQKYKKNIEMKKG